MEYVDNYLEDTEKKLAKEMADLFSKMREQREVMALKGIEDMYRFSPVEGVMYEPCVRIPMSLGPRRGHYYWNDFALPKDEYIIHKHETTYQHQRGQYWDAPTYKCIVLTNYGRCFVTNQVSEGRDFPTNSFIQYNGTYSPDNNRPVIKLEPLSYKIPASILRALKIGMGISGIHITSLHCPNTRGGINERVIKTLSDTSTSLQELNKEFYLFAGKWQPHMTEHATLDIEKMRQTIIENTDSIQDLSGKNRELEEQNKKLQAELQELRQQKTSLEKEKAKLLPLEKYKEVVIDFMDNHYDGDKQYDHYDTSDTDIISIFSDWHTNKVFMDNWEYNDVMKSKEELNEYRIYKKVKGEIVSNGMDNSDVARNVRSIKKTINNPKS
jgi:FtsZ-binding cell division protein ZapB